MYFSEDNIQIRLLPEIVPDVFNCFSNAVILMVLVAFVSNLLIKMI